MLIDITESSRAISFKETKGGNTHVKAQRTTTHHPPAILANLRKEYNRFLRNHLIHIGWIQQQRKRGKT